MKINFTFPIFLFLFSVPILAQVDQVSVGASYSQQAFYSLETGEVEVLPNESWDIAFSAIGQQDAGVFINESSTFMASPLQVFLAETDDWSEAINNTDGYVDSMVLYNPEQNWSEGAMNSIKDPDSPFDFGWGKYSPQTNTVVGDKVYVIKKRNGTYVKFQVVDLIGGEYSFRYANLDGSNEVSSTVNKAAADGPLAYYSLETNKEIDAPTDYDLIFQRYTTSLDDGEGSFIEYTVTGVLLAHGVEAVVARDVDPNDVLESDYSDQYSSLPTTIGHDWKSFDFQAGWLIDFNRTQFVKTVTGDVYQVTFFDFEGSGTGNTTLEKEYITSVSTEDGVDEMQDVAIYPNPTTEYFYIQSENGINLNVKIINSDGQNIRRLKATSNSPVYVNDLPSGIYNITIENNGFISTKRLVVR